MRSFILIIFSIIRFLYLQIFSLSTAYYLEVINQFFQFVYVSKIFHVTQIEVTYQKDDTNESTCICEF
jgi:hypothetical protein